MTEERFRHVFAELSVVDLSVLVFPCDLVQGIPADELHVLAQEVGWHLPENLEKWN